MFAAQLHDGRAPRSNWRVYTNPERTRSASQDNANSQQKEDRSRLWQGGAFENPEELMLGRKSLQTSAEAGRGGRISEAAPWFHTSIPVEIGRAHV